MSGSFNRRSLLASGSSAVVMAASLFPGTASAAGVEQAVPFSSGTAPPRSAVPAKACDAHIHIFSTRFPASPHWKGDAVSDSDVAAYRLFQKRIGTSRAVVVTPSTYGVDNRATLDGVAQLGPSARAVVVLDTDVADAELKRMADGGAVGIRVNFVSPQSWGPTTADRLTTMARKVTLLGWHVQVYMTADQIVEHEKVLSDLPTTLVIDHLGRLPPAVGAAHPAFTVIRRLLDGGRTWMKLSGAYLNTALGPPDYPDAGRVARAFAAAASERMVWGSDWPHRGEKHMPDDAGLIDLLDSWAPNDGVRQRILVENAQELYRFGDS